MGGFAGAIPPEAHVADAGEENINENCQAADRILRAHKMEAIRDNFYPGQALTAVFLPPAVFWSRLRLSNRLA